ncbi:MAG: ubiquinol-cytochrome c reductase cytochrome b subunit, partial [Actinomycetota bacterium]
VIVLIASLFTINPIWTYGPYDPSPISAGTQPDWYIGFADGALRLVPPGWEFVLWGHTWSFNMISVILVLLVFLALVALYPFIEGWVTGDKREHHITDRPRNAPTRTAIGAAGVTFYAVLWAAASSDLMATHFKITLEGVIHTLQALLILGPIIAYVVTKRVCLALMKKDREIALHGYESGRIVRLPGGEYIEVHEQLSDYERWRLVSYEDYKPLMIRPNRKGKITVSERFRASLSRWFFEDRISPVTKGEIEQGGHH